MAQPLKKNAGIALFWSFADKGGQQVIQIVITSILARLITPEEFGLVISLNLFMALANILQDSGFSSALIRKKVVTQEEFTSVFYFNISISIVLYALLFACAPLISNYYDKPVLTDLSRFIFISFIFNAFGSIQNVNMIRNMDFKKNTRITLIAGVISGAIAIIMAFNGFGLWCLAVQLVVQYFLRNLFLWIFIRWSPSGRFSFACIKEMGAYGSKLMSIGVMNQACSNIFPMIIAKYFSFTQTGFYGQANKFNNISQGVIGEGLKTVVYPLLTKTETEEQATRAFRKAIRVASFISFPIALILIVTADSIIRILLSDAFIDAVPMLQILAVSGAIYPLYSLFGVLLSYKGKSGAFFNMELIKNILLLLSIVISIQYGVLALVVGISISNIIAFLLGPVLFTGKLIPYKLHQILLDMLPYLAVAIISFVPLYFLDRLIDNSFLLLAVQLLIGSALYLAIVKIMGSKVLEDCINMIKKTE